jgi:thiol-disulfide isomerase/thioredoxin
MLKAVALFAFLTLTGLSFGQVRASDFAYIDESGATETLWDLRGKVVYISFWASWCKPCLSNFKKYEDLRSTLLSKGVVLLNVNIDDDPNLWKRTVASQKILGSNVWASDMEQIQDDYEIYTIPQYEIVNKQGQLVYLSDAPNRSVIEEFINWLKEE